MSAAVELSDDEKAMRDFFAGLVMLAMIINGDGSHTGADIASDAYAQADTMLAARA